MTYEEHIEAWAKLYEQVLQMALEYAEGRRTPDVPKEGS